MSDKFWLFPDSAFNISALISFSITQITVETVKCLKEYVHIYAKGKLLRHLAFEIIFFFTWLPFYQKALFNHSITKFHMDLNIDLNITCGAKYGKGYWMSSKLYSSSTVKNSYLPVADEIAPREKWSL